MPRLHSSWGVGSGDETRHRSAWCDSFWCETKFGAWEQGYNICFHSHVLNLCASLGTNYEICSLSGALICFVGAEIDKKCVHTLLAKLKSLLYCYTFVRVSWLRCSIPPVNDVSDWSLVSSCVSSYFEVIALAADGDFMGSYECLLVCCRDDFFPLEQFQAYAQMEALSIFYLVIIWKVQNQKARRSNTIVMLTKVLCLQFQHFNSYVSVKACHGWHGGNVSTQFTLLKVNNKEYSKEQTPSDPRRTENDIHNNPKKDDQSENW